MANAYTSTRSQIQTTDNNYEMKLIWLDFCFQLHSQNRDIDDVDACDGDYELSFDSHINSILSVAYDFVNDHMASLW